MTRWLWCSGTKLFLKSGEVKWYTALVLCTACEIGTTYESFSQNLAHIEYFALINKAVQYGCCYNLIPKKADPLTKTFI